jgi:DNA invertase Pin-like site-specific DNA recombinase
MTASKTIKAVGYARRSTDMQERSIPDQQAYVERWAGERGYQLVRWYIDDAISGTSTKGRAAFEKMIKTAENGRDFDFILCYDISRFSRGGTNETGYYLHRLGLAGVQAIFCAEGIPDGDEGELLQGVKSWQARQYSVKLSRDSIRGQHSCVTVRHSGMGGPPPYGYDRQYLSADGQVVKMIRTLSDGRRQELGPDGRHIRYIAPKERMGHKLKSDIVRLVPGDSERIKVVRLIFDMCIQGLGYRAMVIELNRLGILGPMGSFWNHAAVKAVLENPVYRGALAWNKRTFGKLHGVNADGMPRPKKVKESTRNPKDRWIVIENVHEPLISPEVFEKAHAAMAERREKGGVARPVDRYLLSGLIKCLRCGLNFHGTIIKHTPYGDGETRYYVDRGYRERGPTFCRSTSLPSKKLERWVLEQVRRTIFGTGAAEQAIDTAVQALMKKAPAKTDNTAAEKELAAIGNRIRAMLAMLADPDLGDVKEVKQTIVELNHRRDTLRANLEKATTTKDEKPDEAPLRAWATAKFRELERVLANPESTLETRRLVRTYVDRIEVDPDAKVGTLFLPADAASLYSDTTTRGTVGSSSIHS